MSALTVDAAVMTDAVRLTNAQGDGLAYPDSSMGMWPQRTNLCINGGFQTDVSRWVITGGVTVVRDATVSKFGTASAKVTTILGHPNGGIWGGGNGAASSAQIAISASTSYAASAWFLAPAGSAMQLMIEWATAAGATISTITQTFVATGSWQRVTLVGVSPGTAARADIALYTNADIAITYWVDGVQFEAGQWATPYIDTNGASVTRLGGSAYLASDLYNRLSIVQGWVAFRFRPELPTSLDWVVNMFGFGIQGDLTKMVECTWRGNANAAASLVTAARHSAAGNASVNKTNIAWAPGTPLTIVMFWTSTQIGVSVNGSAFATTNIALTAFAPNFFIFGDSVRGPNDSPTNGELLWCMIGNGTIVQADSITLNNQGDADPGLGLLGATAQTVAVIPFTNTVVSSYVDAPVTNDLAGTASLAGAGMTYVQGGGTHVASGTLAGSGTTLLQGGGTHTAAGSLTGAGVVYENGGFAFFADSSFSGAGIRYVQGGGEFDGVSAFGGAGDLIRAAGPTLHGRISRSRVGRVKHR